MKFSVVITVYKRPKELADTINSVVQMDHVGEIIVAENLSGGNGGVQVASNAGARYVSRELGTKFVKSQTCNMGLELAEEELIFFCDQDSEFPQDYLAKMHDLHVRWDNLLAFSDAYRIDNPEFPNYERRIPGFASDWSTQARILPVWHMMYIDGNCTSRTKYAQEARWDGNYQQYGGEVRAFAHRMADQCGVVPCIFEYIWYYHVEHSKIDPAYYEVGEPMPRDKIDSYDLEGKLPGIPAQG